VTRYSLVALLGLVACTKDPAAIQFKAPLVLLSATDLPLATKVLDKGGEVLPEAKVSYALEPASIAVVTASDALRCLKSGDATLTASVGAITRTEPVKCRLVEKVEVPKALRLIIPNDPVELQAKALDASGKPIDDVPFEFTPADPAVVRVDGTWVAPKKVGTTTIAINAGAQAAHVPVTVVRKMKAEPLLLNDGNRTSISLNQGTYEAEVKVRSGDTRFGVTLKWIGGSNCKDEPEAQTIASRCVIDNVGSLVVENPSTFGMGPAADGVLAIYQVP